MIEVLEKKILILKQESAVPFTQKIKRFWMVFALITILLIGVGGYYYWFPLSSSQADASSAIEQARNIVNKQNEVVRKNNEMIQSYDVINRKANEMQLSIRSGVTPDKQKAGEIVTQLKQIKPKIAAYQVKVNQLKSMTETASSGSNPSYVKFYQSVLELVHAYEAYENALQKVADSDLHYFETLASGKKPVPDHFNQLLQNEKNSFVKCNDLEEKMMLEWKKLTDSYSSKHLNDPI